jgi:peptidoglycan/xylan/chitin deacetylase (PgdA/CDA1 family)
MESVAVRRVAMTIGAAGAAAAAMILTAPTSAVTPVAPAPAPEWDRDATDHATRSGARRAETDGAAFPDKVVALTWDDGPDANTLALATYLNRARISATFFVVGSWIDHLSEEPGVGKDVFMTGYTFLPILDDLAALGHRVANHTAHHVLLAGASAATVTRELAENQRALDPLATNELRLFRAPGGFFDVAASGAIDADPYLRTLIGPIRWDIDAKDWEASRYCRSSSPATECERDARGDLRVLPRVTAARYVAAIEKAGHGIVLLHDRVGDVGSDYALAVARALVPALADKGFVFAAPLLAFSPLEPRTDAGAACAADPGDGTRAFADVDGDGRADACTVIRGGLSCARAGTVIAGADEGRRPRAVFREARAAEARAPWAFAPGALRMGDVDGDGRADACARDAAGMRCAIARADGGFRAAAAWSDDGGDAFGDAIRLGDIDGDGRADVCGRAPRGILCATSRGDRFARARPWFALPTSAAPAFATFELGDVNGDGKADLCGRGEQGAVCAISNGRAFVGAWPLGAEIGPIDAMGDLNGDGRADVCGRAAGGVVCALSTGRGFARGSVWLAAGAAAGFSLADINGDGRGDLCTEEAGSGLVCGLAP